MQQKFFLGQSPLGFHRSAYMEWGQASKTPPVICVHGLTRNGRDFDALAKRLLATKRVFCPDVVGRGKSDWLSDPSFYNYPQYLADMTALIARTSADQVDWVGTSMGGIIGMLLAAQAQTPLRRLVINDVGPFIPLVALKRIADYVGIPIEFADLDQLERYIRSIYASFGITKDEDWHFMAEHSARKLPNGKLMLAHDPAIAKNFQTLDKDADFWSVYDQIRCPVLLIHGKLSDILTADVAHEMTKRGPKAKLMEIEGVGHAPALMSDAQTQMIADFLI